MAGWRWRGRAVAGTAPSEERRSCQHGCYYCCYYYYYYCYYCCCCWCCCCWCCCCCCYHHYCCYIGFFYYLFGLTYPDVVSIATTELGQLLDRMVDNRACSYPPQSINPPKRPRTSGRLWRRASSPVRRFAGSPVRRFASSPVRSSSSALCGVLHAAHRVRHHGRTLRRLAVRAAETRKTDGGGWRWRTDEDGRGRTEDGGCRNVTCTSPLRGPARRSTSTRRPAAICPLRAPADMAHTGDAGQRRVFGGRTRLDERRSTTRHAGARRRF